MRIENQRSFWDMRYKLVPHGIDESLLAEKLIYKYRRRDIMWSSVKKEKQQQWKCRINQRKVRGNEEMFMIGSEKVLERSMDAKR